MPSYTHFSSTPSLTELLDLGERLWHEQAEERSMPSFNLKRLWTVAEGYMDWEKEARDFEQTRNILAQLEPNDFKNVQIFSNEQIEQLETLSQAEHEASALRLYPELRSFLSTQKQLVERSRMIDGDVDAFAFTRETFRTEFKPRRASDAMILLSDYKPDTWGKETPFFYQGLLFSALFFNEAKNYKALCQLDAAWASLTQAFYHLGSNSSSRTMQEASRDHARNKGSRNSHEIRMAVLELIAAIPKDGTNKTLSAAVDLVIEKFKTSEKYARVLLEFKTLSSKKKTSAETQDDTDVPFDRFRKTLLRWAGSRSPYPDVRSAFAPFRSAQGNDS